MPNLREYFYPYIDGVDGWIGSVTYEYYYTGTSNPYCKTIVYPGITLPDYPTYSGSVYFTRKDAFWGSGGYVIKPNLWYMRQRTTGGVDIIEEIIDQGLPCTEWPSGWGPVYHRNNNITHGHGDTPGSEFESCPICTSIRTGPGAFYIFCRARWFSTCEYVQYHASLDGYPDVIEMKFGHGGYDYNDGLPISPCPSYPWGLEHRAPFNSFWSKAWYAKGEGKIREEIFSEDSCTGPFSISLHAAYGT